MTGSSKGTTGRRQRIVVATTVAKQAAWYMRGQLSFIRNKGFDVTLVTSAGGPAVKLAADEGIDHAPIEMSREISLLSDLRALWQICRLFRELRPTVVNAGTPKAALLVLLAAWICRVPCRVYTLRGLRYETARGPLRHVLKLTERFTGALAHMVVCVSPSIRSEALAQGLFEPSKTIVLGNGSSNGLDVERFQRTSALADSALEIRNRLGIPEAGTVAGFVGRVVGAKGITELVQAWDGLQAEFPLLHLLICGDFEPEDPLPTDIKTRLTSDARIHLVGHVVDTAPYYAMMDLLVLPTYREGFPNVIIEAAAMEVPAVATSVSGCTDAVVDGKTGILVPPYDAKALQEALRVYVTDPELRRSHARAGLERATGNFRRELIWQGLFDLYSNILQKNGVLPTETLVQRELSR
jgi:glycosyltransferase involved in cell wall biosynthesis